MPIKEGSESIAWKKIFDKYDIFKRLKKSKLPVYLTFADMKKTTNRPTRLLNNAFTDRENAPRFMIDGGVSPIAVSRTTNAIGFFDNYIELSYDGFKPKNVVIPSWVKSLKTSSITTEGALIGCINVCGILKDICGDIVIHQTLFGKQGAGNLSFFVNNLFNKKTPYKLSVLNPQIEIDNCWESKNTIIIAESKLADRPPTHLLIRQLFHPYQAIKRAIKPINKKIIGITIVKLSNKPFSIRIFVFEFKDTNKYNSIKLIEHHDYIIRDNDYVTFV